MDESKENLIKTINEQIGDANPTLDAITRIISDGFSYTNEEAFKIASGIIMQRAGIKLINNYDTEVIASLIGKEDVSEKDATQRHRRNQCVSFSVSMVMVMEIICMQTGI